jgi:uncharacterized membrane protein
VAGVRGLPGVVRLHRRHLVNHHYLFTQIARVNGALLWRNPALLLAMSVLPFPTAVVASAFQYEDLGDERTAVVFYALMAGAAAVTWLVRSTTCSAATCPLSRQAGWLASPRCDG